MKHFALASVLAGLLVATPAVLLGGDVQAPVRVPMNCTRGPDDVVFRAVANFPESPPSGSTFTVRIDSESSGLISHVGLNYIHGMTTVYVVPPGLRYVEGSARVIPGTGTVNARPGAHARHESGRIYLVLPARIENGTSFTPPSLAFDLYAEAAPGTRLALAFAHYEVVANAFLIGDLHTDCEPVPKPYRIGVLRIDPPAEP